MKRPILLGCLALAGTLALGLTFLRAGDDQRQRRHPLADIQEQLGKNGRVVQSAAAAPQVEKVEKSDKKPAKTKFLRLKRDKKDVPTALQTAIVRYVPAKGKGDLVIDLVSVVHVGERAYYHRLNQRFEDYDAVLYELVAPKGVVPKPGKGSDNPLAFLQKAITMVLQLDLQTSCIDYTCTNFIHADLTPEEMAQKIKARGDTPLTIGLSVIADMLREANLKEMKLKEKPGKQQPDLDLFALLSDPEAPSKIKRIMAEQLEEQADGTGLGKTIETILIDDRNAACMKVLQKEIRTGKKKIAIFYGAAHMPDFERRLVEDFGMRRDSEDWLTAWDLRPRPINLFRLLEQFGP